MSNFYDRMREAADTLEEASERLGNSSHSSWTPEALRIFAENFERDAAEQEALVEQLAQTIHDHGDPHGAWEDARDFVQDPIRSSARAILAQFDVTPKTTGAQKEQG